MERNGKSAPRLHARIADLLTAEIAENRHAAGTRLVEAQLVTRFGVSRAPVRQALARLAEQGLVSYEPRRGYIVEPGSQERAQATGIEAPPATPEMGGLGARHIWQSIYSDVESTIISRIPFGDWHVPETALANHFDVSRTVVRDVLARLQSQGLVHMDGGRWIAPGLTTRRVDELYRLRAILEPAALVEAADQLPPTFAERLLAAHEAAASSPPDSDGLDALETNLHVDLLAYCNNNALLQAIRQPQSLLVAHRFLYVKTRELYASEPFIDEHAAILNALIEKKLGDAAELMQRHLMGSRKRAMDRIATLPDSIPDDEVSYLRQLSGSTLQAGSRAIY
jgi:DNA-binding GntR family transcriptional regulator